MDFLRNECSVPQISCAVILHLFCSFQKHVPQQLPRLEKSAQQPESGNGSFDGATLGILSSGCLWGWGMSQPQSVWCLWGGCMLQPWKHLSSALCRTPFLSSFSWNFYVSEFRVLLGFHRLVEHIFVLRKLSQQTGESLGWFRVPRLRGTEGPPHCAVQETPGDWGEVHSRRG